MNENIKMIILVKYFIFTKCFHFVFCFFLTNFRRLINEKISFYKKKDLYFKEEYLIFSEDPNVFSFLFHDKLKAIIV